MRDTADFGSEAFDQKNENVGVYPRFYMEAVRNEGKSAEAGRPIFEDKEYVEIVAAGNSTNIVVKPVRANEVKRFPREYRMFKDGQAEQVIGTPLSEVPWMTKAMVEELKYLRVLTVEHLAALSDSVCGNSAGLYEAKRKAGIWIKASDSSAPFTKLEQENAELKEQMAGMKIQLDELVKASAAPKKG